jgi:hypothetical protein
VEDAWKRRRETPARSSGQGLSNLSLPLLLYTKYEIHFDDNFLLSLLLLLLLSHIHNVYVVYKCEREGEGEEGRNRPTEKGGGKVNQYDT